MVSLEYTQSEPFTSRLPKVVSGAGLSRVTSATASPHVASSRSRREMRSVQRGGRRYLRRFGWALQKLLSASEAFKPRLKPIDLKPASLTLKCPTKLNKFILLYLCDRPPKLYG